jgi:tRNA A-37 threonylcarbamoyl transferase component Bud32
VTYGLVRDTLRHIEPGSELKDLGEHRLRDLRYTERIYQLVVPDLPADFPPLRTHGLVTPVPPGDPTPLEESPGRPAPHEAPRDEGRYQRKGRLGGGGMAEVYLAHDQVLDRDVALKVLRQQYAEDEEFVERFEREAKSAAALNHPNIVAVYDRGKAEDGSYYIAMEYVPGGSLKEHLLEEAPLAPRAAVTLALQIAKALEAAHKRGVIHRDIKPQNVLLTEEGEAKVADFGIARAASSATMTKTGSVLGTAHYLSPEQALGQQATTRSDLYSLGVVLYEMLTGGFPYDADTPLGVAMQAVSGELHSPKEVRPEVPEGVDAVAVRLLARDLKDRYQSATEVVEDLERVQREEAPMFAGPPAAPQTPPGREDELAGGTRQDATGSTASREAVLEGRTAGAPRASRRPLLLVGLVGVLLVLLLGGAAIALTSLGLGSNLLGGSERQPANGNPPAQQPDNRNAGAPAGGTNEAEAEEEVRAAAEDYYEAVDREDWAYTYDNLDSRTQQMFTEVEWSQKNQWFADNEGLELSSLDVDVDLSSSETIANVTVDSKDGTSLVRDTYFVSEDGSWKHRFSQEETALFMPDASYEEFVAAQQGTSATSSATSPATGSATGEEATVESAIRGHYEAIGDQNFEAAYSYFGPTFRSTMEEAIWIEEEESYDIQNSTIYSIEVNEVSGYTAVATVDVSFEDNTGTPRFSITWELVQEGGEWKLNEQVSAQKTG